jgi:hypothetical protein
LVLAVGSQPLPEKWGGIEPQHVHPQIGEEEHHLHHFEEDLGIGVVEIPLIAVESGPYPTACAGHGRNPGEVARRLMGKDLRQGPLIGIGLAAIGEGMEIVQILRFTVDGALRPFMLPGHVIQHQIEAQTDPPCPQLIRPGL